jgi:hypothetical protein
MPQRSGLSYLVSERDKTPEANDGSKPSTCNALNWTTDFHIEPCLYKSPVCKSSRAEFEIRRFIRAT